MALLLTPAATGTSGLAPTGQVSVPLPDIPLPVLGKLGGEIGRGEEVVRWLNEPARPPLIRKLSRAVVIEQVV